MELHYHAGNDDYGIFDRGYYPAADAAWIGDARFSCIDGRPVTLDEFKEYMAAGLPYMPEFLADMELIPCYGGRGLISCPAR